MRKTMLILLVLTLCLIPCLAEEDETATIDCNFGDFTISVPDETMGSVAEEITDNETFFVFYDAETYDESADFNGNLNGIWGSTWTDLTDIDPDEIAQSIIDQAVTSYAAIGIVVNDAEILSAELGDVDGKTALIVSYTGEHDYTGAGYDLVTQVYYTQYIISDESIGTYTFTITSDSEEGAGPFIAMMDSLVWND